MFQKKFIFLILNTFNKNKDLICYSLTIYNNKVNISYEIDDKWNLCVNELCKRFLIDSNNDNIKFITDFLILCHTINEVYYCINYSNNLERKKELMKTIKSYIYDNPSMLHRLYDILLLKLISMSKNNIGFIVIPMLNYYQIIKNNNYNLVNNICLRCGNIVLKKYNNIKISYCKSCTNKNHNSIYHDIEYKSDGIRYNYIMNSKKLLSDNFIFDYYIQKTKKFNKSFVKKNKEQRQSLETYYRLAKPIVEKHKYDSFLKNLNSKIKENTLK